MVRCRNFQKTLVIEIIPSPSIKDKLIANFHRLFYIRYRRFEIKSERGKPEFVLHLMEEFDNIDCNARCNRDNR